MSSVSRPVTCNSPFVEMKNSIRSSAPPSPVVVCCLTFTRYFLGHCHLHANSPADAFALDQNLIKVPGQIMPGMPMQQGPPQPMPMHQQQQKQQQQMKPPMGPK